MQAQPSHRLAPLAVTDGQGMQLGLVDVEPLLLAGDTSNATGDTYGQPA